MTTQSEQREYGAPTYLLTNVRELVSSNHDVAFVARPAMADWLARQLGAI